MMGHYRKKSITTQNYGKCESIHLKTCRQNAEVKPSKVQTQNLDASSLKTSKTGDGTKQFWDDEVNKFHKNGGLEDYGLNWNQ